jgi:hypothetical protein
MKITPLITLGLFCCAMAFGQLPPQPPRPPQPPAPPHPGQPPAAPKDTANFLITVTWNDAKAGTNSLQVLSAEGSFNLDTIQSSVRINNADIPTTVSFNGTITPLGPEKARLKIFLGRTVPYVTSTFSGGAGAQSSSYQQMRVGLDSAFTVTFDKPMVVQADQNGEVSVLVKRQEN